MAAFHGDEFFQKIVKDIVQKHHLKSAIETGTYHGDSSLFMEELGLAVNTIEAREDYFNHAKERFRQRRVFNFLGDSRSFLKTILHAFPESCLVFLDAHWQDDWPLKEELDILINVRSKTKNVVIIDDFDVPNSRMKGSAGGGGTVGDPLYGPRKEIDRTPCSLETFEEKLKVFDQIWFPSYDSDMPGYVIASDLDLSGIGNIRRHK